MRSRRSLAILATVLLALTGAQVAGPAAGAPAATAEAATAAVTSAAFSTTALVSVSRSGGVGNGASAYVAISGNGRYVAFASHATNLVAGDTNRRMDVFVRDLRNNTTRRVSLAQSGAQANLRSLQPALSADGRYVAFTSDATNLVAGDTNAQPDVFVRDTVAGTTRRVSVGAGGAQANGDSAAPAISATGRFIAFVSGASNLVRGDTNGQSDLFVRDTVAGTTTRISVGPGGVQSDAFADAPTISGDGRFVVFASPATTLVPGDTNGLLDLFLRDRVAGITTRISVGPGGVQANGPTTQPAISADARHVAFVSEATNLAPTDTDPEADVLIRNLITDTNQQVSFRNDNLPGSFASEPDVSGDGRFVAFVTPSPLTPGEPEGVVDVYVRDVVAGTTTLISVATDGTPANLPSFDPAISDAGGRVAFQSAAANLVAGDNNNFDDIFVRR